TGRRRPTTGGGRRLQGHPRGLRGRHHFGLDDLGVVDLDLDGLRHEDRFGAGHAGRADGALPRPAHGIRARLERSAATRAGERAFHGAPRSVTDSRAARMMPQKTFIAIEMASIFPPLGLPWITQISPRMQPIPEQRTARTTSPVLRSWSSALYFLDFFAFL